MFDKMGKSGALLLGALLIVTVAYADAVTAYELSLAPFYLVPLLLIAWNAGRSWGFFSAAISFFLLLLVGLIWGHPYSSPFYFYFDSAGKLLSFLVVVFIASKLKGSFEKERQLARTDSLTHTANRTAFYEFVSAELERQKRYGHPFSLLYLDFDNFKRINDTLGHHAGDNLLRGVADALRTSVRRSDLVARMGGDEFAIFLPETASGVSDSVVQHLKAVLEEAVRRMDYPVTFSIGVAVFQNPPDSIDQVLERADSLLCRIKQSGKSSILQEVF